MEIWQILTIVFGLLAAFFGFYWTKAKMTIKELGILFSLMSAALKDDELTKEELRLIVDQIIKIIDIFRKKGTVSKKTIEESKKKVIMIKK